MSKHDVGTGLIDLQAETLSETDRLRGEVAQAQARIAAALAVLDGDAGFVVAVPWATGARKLDRCAHGVTRREGCEACLDAALRAALAEPTPDTGETEAEAARAELRAEIKTIEAASKGDALLRALKGRFRAE